MFAADQECIDAQEIVWQGCEFKTEPHEWTARFCSPQLDEDGDPIPAGTLGNCFVSLDGEAFIEKTVTEPGVIFTHTWTSKGPNHVVEAFCKNAEGMSGASYQTAICFPGGIPGKPKLLP